MCHKANTQGEARVGVERDCRARFVEEKVHCVVSPRTTLGPMKRCARQLKERCVLSTLRYQTHFFFPWRQVSVRCRQRSVNPCLQCPAEPADSMQPVGTGPSVACGSSSVGVTNACPSRVFLARPNPRPRSQTRLGNVVRACRRSGVTVASGGCVRNEKVAVVGKIRVLSRNETHFSPRVSHETEDESFSAWRRAVGNPRVSCKYPVFV